MEAGEISSRIQYAANLKTKTNTSVGVVNAGGIGGISTRTSNGSGGGSNNTQLGSGEDKTSNTSWTDTTRNPSGGAERGGERTGSTAGTIGLGGGTSSRGGYYNQPIKSFGIEIQYSS